jgi:hypothetical protein
VVQGDIREQAALLGQADVVIMHNVFEWFASRDEQLALWSFVAATLRRPGVRLVTVPPLETSLADAGVCLLLFFLFRCYSIS